MKINLIHTVFLQETYLFHILFIYFFFEKHIYCLQFDNACTSIKWHLIVNSNYYFNF